MLILNSRKYCIVTVFLQLFMLECLYLPLKCESLEIHKNKQKRAIFLKSYVCLHSEEFKSWKHLCLIVNGTVIHAVQVFPPKDWE